MLNQVQNTEQEDYLSVLKASRKGPAVLKARLVTFRSSVPSGLVFAFEGDDDKIVYFHWIKQIDPNLRYEPFPCDGKKDVLDLKEMLDRDLNNLGKDVYFFVDRDFDDLRGMSESKAVFMTDSYSIENHIVEEAVLDELLKNEFHFHAQPECRQKVAAVFSNLYDTFIDITKPVNFRLFLARRLNIELRAPLPTKISRLADVSLLEVTATADDASVVVQLKREPSGDEIAVLRSDFEALSPKTRYRGKFALMFFVSWLHALADDRNGSAPRFGPRASTSKVHPQRLTLDTLASKSRVPEGLRDFLATLSAPVAA
ncbi:DUF4435 domain-containing protein [Paraburkholderia sp. IW21]|uniref:DUF4435 domain-containing protein n=1 Tax=Paraburkholderia sp. IW21 TaxID=3242488 RepID=UPI003521FD8B